MLEVAIRSIHFVGIMVLFAALFSEHMLITKEMKKEQLRKVAIIDAIFGISALLVLAAGILLWFYVGNMPEFYTKNWIFHLKITLFIVVALLSIFPTLFFIKNRNSNEEIIIIPGYVLGFIRAELFILLCIPLLAAAMAKGIGIS